MEDATGPMPQHNTTALGPVDHQKKTSQEAIQRLTVYLSEKGAVAEVVEVWEYVLAEREELKAEYSTDSHVTNAILGMKKEIQAEIQEVRTVIEGMREGTRILENKLTGLSL